MTKVLVPGAGGQIARWAVPMLAGRDREHQGRPGLVAGHAVGGQSLGGLETHNRSGPGGRRASREPAAGPALVRVE